MSLKEALQHPVSRVLELHVPLSPPILVLVVPPPQGSGVSRVGSGYGRCIYGLGRLAASIRQHKRGRIESLMTRGIFHRALHPPTPTPPHPHSPFKVRTLFFSPSPTPPSEGINRGQAGFSKLTLHPRPPVSLAGDVLKGTPREIAG